MNTCAVLILAIVSAGTGFADPGDQVLKLEAFNDTSFGSSIAVNNAYIVVGSPSFSSSGRVRLFETATGAQIGDPLGGAGAQFGDSFGASVAISGTTLLVGSTGDDDEGSFSGSAYLIDASSRQQLFKLLDGEGGAFHYFGNDVALDGTTALVAAYLDSNSNGSTAGSVSVFDATTGQKLFKLLADDGASGDLFGASIDLHGTTAIIGAPEDDDSGAGSGSAYLFDTTTGLQIRKLLPEDGGQGDRFGSSVAIFGNTAVVGATDDDENGEDSGSAYIFNLVTGQQLFKISPADGSAGDGFGGAISINSDTAIIGAEFDGNFGSAYLFDLDSGQQVSKLLSSDGVPASAFGRAVSILGSESFVAASSVVYSFDTFVNPVFPVQPPAFTVVDLGETPLELTLVAGGFGPFTYQWRLDGVSITDNENFSGATTATLTVNPLLTTVGVYDAVITNISGSSVTEPSALAVRNRLPSDINGDGIVDTADLGILLGVFGNTNP